MEPGIWSNFTERMHDLVAVVEEPTVTIDLMYGRTAENDPFYARVVREFYDDARARHAKLPLIGRFEWGVALLRLPESFERLFMLIEGSARRNVKKAERAGYQFSRVDFNSYRTDIAEIRASTPTRQGPMPSVLLHGDVRPVIDPPSRTDVHDYPWFGVLKNGKLVAYASCLVAGEACLLNHVFGHAAHEYDGIVPQLFMGIAAYIYENYPYVKYFGYDTYFGASPSLRRFKRKLGFTPHHVHWVLDGGHSDEPPIAENPAMHSTPVHLDLSIPEALDYQLIYRHRAASPQHVDAIDGATFHYLENPAGLAFILGPAQRRFGPRGFLKAGAKLATETRSYFCVEMGGEIVSDGWVTLGRCTHYPIGPRDVVIGPIWTDPNQRGKGLATFALKHTINALFLRGHDVSWIDTSRDNLSMQKVIARAGYGAPIASIVRND